MKARLTVMLGLVVVFALDVEAAVTDNGVLTANADVSVQSTEQWVTGTRLWVAATIKNVLPSQIEGPVLETRPFVFRGYSYKLGDRDSGTRIAGHEYKIPPFGEVLLGADGEEVGTAMPDCHKINSQETLRLLFSIPWPNEANLPPGDYDLALTVHAVIGELGRAALKVTVRDPTEEEEAILKALDLEEGEWASTKDNNLEIRPPDSLKRDTGLIFELCLSRLSEERESAAEISEDELPKDIPSFFLPELDALRYEILKAKKLDNEAMELRGKVLAEHPGLRFRFEQADEGAGIIARAITQRRIEQQEAQPLASD